MNPQNNNIHNSPNLSNTQNTSNNSNTPNPSQSNDPANFLPRPSRPTRNRDDRFSNAARIARQIHRYRMLLGKFWWIMLLGALLGVGPAFILISSSKPEYKSVGRMYVPQKMTMQSGQLYTDEIQNFMGTQVELLKSSRINALAMDKLLKEQPELEENGVPPTFDLTVVSDRNSQSLTITAIGLEPKSVQGYVKNIMETYQEYKRDLKEQSSEHAFQSLTNQLSKLEAEIQVLRDSLSDFRATNDVVMLEHVGSGRSQELGAISTELSRSKRELDILSSMTPEEMQSVLEDEKENGDSDGVDSNTSFSSDASLIGGESRSEYYKNMRELRKLTKEREELAQGLKDSHPLIVELDEKIVDLNWVIDDIKNTGVEDMKVRKAALEVKVKQLQESFNSMEKQTAAADKLLATYANMQEDLTRKRDMYQRISEMLQTVDLSKVFTNDSFSILEDASKPVEVTQRAKKLGIGLLIGLLLGFGVLYLINLFDDTFETLSELNEQIGETVLGQIPEVSTFSPIKGLPSLLADTQRNHALLESFRNLRSSILFSYPEGEVPKTICVSSSVPMEGKTTIITYLALMLALSGSRVLLVDADIRRGCIHETMDVSNKPGLIEFLLQEVSLNEIIRKTPNEKLDFIPRGSGGGNGSAELFFSPALDVLLNEGKQQYDFIVADSAPLLATDDTTNLARKMDGVLFVVRGSFTSVRFARESLNRLHGRRIPVMGLVFNRGRVTRGDGYRYYYDYYYEYSDPNQPGVRKKHRRRKHKYAYSDIAEDKEGSRDSSKTTSENTDEKK